MAMNLSLGRLPWYGQIGIFALLAGVAVGGFWYAYARPAQESLATRRAELESLKDEIDRGLVIARRLPQFRKEVASEEAQLNRLRVVLPEERDVSDLLRRVQAMATQSNLTILGFTPQAITSRETHAEWPIGLRLAGTYHNLAGFLERVSKFPRVINVKGIVIRANERDPNPAATITAECTATTFVLTQQQPAAEEPAGRGRGRAARPARGRAAGARGRG
jgi:Tfp pilus assembly protein PilO